MTIGMIKRLSKALLWVTLNSIWISVIAIVLLQDFMLFPELITSPPWNKTERRSDGLPSGVTSQMVQTNDGVEFELWRVSPKNEGEAKLVALLLHGNAGTADNFYLQAAWLASHGITVYQQEYRGFGKSSGWPSVEGIKSDADLAVLKIAEDENIATSEIIPVGLSLGTGFASYVAEKYQTRALILDSPYQSLAAVANGRALVGWLVPFMWNSLDQEEHISKLQDTCVIAAHGTLDEIIPYQNSVILEQSYRGTAGYTLLTVPGGDHITSFSAVHDKVIELLKKCLLGDF